jgi:CRISPR system Cascade subunit CasD
MPEFLVFGLYGPLASWGGIAVGEQRPTTPHPSKSAILGLVAAALGIRRDEDKRQEDLVAGYGYAVRVDAPGVLLRDYHTTQYPDATSRLKHLRSRRDETRDRQNLYTVLSTRDYRCDGLYTVCLWPLPDKDAPPPEAIAAALRRPNLPLYLGRKSCPLALPLLPQCITAETFDAAIQQYDIGQTDEVKQFQRERLKLEKAAAPDYYWDELAPTQLSLIHTTPRNDLPLSRRRWQFGKRNEHYGRSKP